MKQFIQSPKFPLVLAIACAHFAVDFMISIFPAYKTMFNIDLAVASIIAGCSVFIAEAMQLMFGKWIDKGHHKLLLIAGILATAAASFYPYTTHIATVGLLLILTYLGSSSFHPAASSILGGLHGHNKSVAMGFFATFGMAGMSLGQIFFSWTVEFVNGHTAILGILGALTASILFFIPIPEPVAHPHKKNFSLSIIWKFFSSTSLRTLYFIQLANQTLLWATVFILPDLLKERLYPEWIIYGGGHMFFIMGGAIASIPAGIISSKFTPQKTIGTSFCLAFLFLAQLLLFQSLPVPFLLTLLFCFGASLGASPPLIYALGSELVPHNRGMVSAFLMGLVWIISETIGLGGTGIIADFFTENKAQYALCFLTLLSISIGASSAYRLLNMKNEELVFEMS